MQEHGAVVASREMYGNDINSIALYGPIPSRKVRPMDLVSSELRHLLPFGPLTALVMLPFYGVSAIVCLCYDKIRS